MSILKKAACLLTASLLALPAAALGPLASGSVEAAGNAVSIEDYGAVPDDGLDDLSAIRQALSAAKASGKSVYVPPGTFLYSDVIVLNGVNLAGDGEQSVLRSTNPERQAVQIAGQNSKLSAVKLTTVPVSTRLSSSVSARVHVLP